MVKKLKFTVRLDGMAASEVASLSPPCDVEKTFGTKARVPVRGTVNGFPFRSSLMKRTVEPPPLLLKELGNSKTAKTNWEKESFTNKNEMARSILEVKQEETRVRRLAKVMEVLKNGKKWTG
jgi:hypothetical protein